jgi:hypothetical protein
MKSSPVLRILIALLALLVVPCLGAVAGFGLARVYWGGALTRWQRLPDPPAPAAEIVDGGTRLAPGGWWLTVRGADDRLFHCPPYDGCWVEVTAPPAEAAEPCLYPYDARPPAPPGPVADRLEAQACNAEAAYQASFVVLEDGTVWRWGHSVAGLSSLVELFLFVAGGAALGLLLALPIALAVLLVGRRPRPARPG